MARRLYSLLQASFQARMVRIPLHRKKKWHLPKIRTHPLKMRRQTLLRDWQNHQWWWEVPASAWFMGWGWYRHSGGESRSSDKERGACSRADVSWWENDVVSYCWRDPALQSSNHWYHPRTHLYVVACISSLRSTFDLFITDEIIKLLCTHTKLHGRRRYRDWMDVDDVDIRIIHLHQILAAIHHSGHEATCGMWDDKTAQAIFRAAVPL